MKHLVKILTMMGCSIASSLASGALLSQLWEWFIVKKFQLPPLKVVEGIGLCMTVNLMFQGVYLTLGGISAKLDKLVEKESENVWFSEMIGTTIGMIIATPLILLMGWFWFQFL